MVRSPSASDAVGDYWNHTDRVSSFKKKGDVHHKLTPAQQAQMECVPAYDLAPVMRPALAVRTSPNFSAAIMAGNTRV